MKTIAGFLSSVAVLSLVSLSFQVHADPIVQTQSIGVHVPGYTTSVTFDQYDETTYGELASVEIVFTISMYGGSIEWDNDSTDPANVSGTLGVKSELTSTDVTLNNGSENPWETVYNTVNDSFTLQGTTGDSTTQFDQTEDVDYAILAGPSSGNPQVVTVTATIDAAYLNDFIGTGTFGIDYEAWQYTLTSSDGGTYSVSSPSSALASVQVTYTPVPEPSTMALAGCGLLALWWRRRKNRTPSHTA